MPLVDGSSPLFTPYFEDKITSSISMALALGVIPLVKIFTRSALEDALSDAGFSIDHAWQPGRGKAVFIVARKLADTA